MQDETLGSKFSGKLRQTKLSLAEKARNMHTERKSSPHHRTRADWPTDKIIVMGMLERGGRVRAQVVADRLSAPALPRFRLQGLVNRFLPPCS